MFRRPSIITTSDPTDPMISARFRRVTRRDFLIAAAPVVLIIVAAFVLAYQFVKPAPPKKIVIAAGQHEGGYFYFAKRYADFLKRNGVTLEIRESGGAVENIELLTAENSDVDVAFVQSGTAFAANAPHLVSLGSLYYEPLWVFYRGAPVTDFDQLKRRNIAIGSDESGTRSLALQLLAVNGNVLPPTKLLPIGGKEAGEQLIDAQDRRCVHGGSRRFPAHPATRRNTGHSTAERRPCGGVHASLPLPHQADLAQRRVRFHRPMFRSEDVMLVSPTANLIAKDTLHPALAYLLMRAATEVHGGSGLLQQAGEFPAALDADFPLSPEAQRYYKSGPPFLQRYLPFWAANLVERLWVMLVPAIAIMVPLFRLVPPLYRWRVRSRIYRWYARLKEIELELERDPGAVSLEEMLERLDQIDHAVNRIPTPLAYSENLYSFRQHIDLVRDRVERALQGEASETNAASRPGEPDVVALRNAAQAPISSCAKKASTSATSRVRFIGGRLCQMRRP